MSTKKKITAPPVATVLPLLQLRDERNVRQVLGIEDGWLVDSVRENGIIVPLVVEPAPDAPEVFDVVQGKRRLAAARQAELTEAPVYVLDPARREVGLAYIEMLVENAEEGRKALTDLEQADALFLAIEAGMAPAAAARRAGRSDDDVAHAVATARKVSDRTRRTLAESDGYEWDLSVLAVLAEFDDDEEAVARLVDAHAKGTFEHQATAERDAREACQAREVVREECRANGVRLVESEEIQGEEFEEFEILEYLWDKAGDQLTEEGHAECPGHAVTWDDDSDTPDALLTGCIAPDEYGHLGYPGGLQTEEEPEEPEEESQEAESGPRVAVVEEPAGPVTGRQEGNRGGDQKEGEKEDGGEGEEDVPPLAPAPRPAPVVKPVPDSMERKLKIAGNAAYRAATKTRRTWLKDVFLQRKTAPPTLAGWVTGQWLAARKPVQMWTGEVSRVALVAELLGEDKRADNRTTWAPAGATPGKLNLINFAIIAGCYEKRLDEVQTWRTDKPSFDTNDIRDDARVYLSYLATIGYTLSLVEQAIVDDVEFNALITEGQTETPEDTADGQQPDPAPDTGDADDQDDAGDAGDDAGGTPQETSDEDAADSSGDGPEPDAPDAVDPAQE
ncbi:ParB/RepB/Spo0J family partition protein [Streptomyces sp. NBC_00237]|uniref:ParB/RepB/Spo0J family partition protein n=1 Tax=Streptomyces sp. NBC_00237 TaxID=2975687 RepID=UPI00224EC6B2|nr:ParB/RepB/Spo0J family partition protein [Streptomyces sp. NBC_00237]MCX5206107.1 ParB/RepB/Spo0J family partition protein [Streptomyces sp. NBC_00237]